jgi:hypothetical protein
MLFSTAKKIEELQAKLQAAIDENETLKANALTAQAELDRINSTLRAEEDEDEDEDKAEDEDEDKEKMKRAKKAKRAKRAKRAKMSEDEDEDEKEAEEHDDEEEVDDEDEDYEAEEDKEEESKKGKKSAAAKVIALKAKFNSLTSKVSALESTLDAKVSAAVSATLAKIGIDPIHAGATADGTKPAAEKPKGRNGIERAGALLNEKIKAKQ